MEVHHHSHTPADPGSHQARKKWTHYFWEFLMLFLAVFCGFLAENIREHSIERHREKEFMQTMIRDLEEDTLSLSRLVKVYKQKGIELDSLVFLLKNPVNNERGAQLYYYGRKANRIGFFACIDRTIQQMKNSGGFRLVKNDKAASSILRYYSQMTGLYLLQDNFNNQSIEYRVISMSVFDPLILETIVNDSTNNDIIPPAGNPALLTYEKSSLLKLMSILHYMQGSRRVMQNEYMHIKEAAEKLTAVLKKEYHLK